MAQKLPLKEFKAIYSKVPRLCVDLVIKDDNKVLLTRRDIPPDLGWWHFPGGTVLMRETLEEAIQRVAEEELNTKVKIIRQVGMQEYPKSGLGYSIAAVFLVEPLSEMKGGEQAHEIKFFSAPPGETLPEVKEFLEENTLLVGTLDQGSGNGP